MPELPEVEVFRRFAERHGLKRPIAGVEVSRPKILAGITSKALVELVVGRQFTEARRHGKHLLLRLGEARSSQSSGKTARGMETRNIEKVRTGKGWDGKREGMQEALSGWLFLHFGMTGYLSWADDETSAVNAYGDPARPRDHVRVRFDFEDGSHLAFHEQRMFGKLGTLDDPDAYIARLKLGPDALSIEEADFARRLKNRKGQAKPALMDQSVVAGIGNVYADEMLFQCRIHPERQVSTLTPKDMHCLYVQMVEILQRTVDCNADRTRLPKTYILHARGKNSLCPRHDTLLATKTIGGRNTYFCPECQK